MCAFSRRRGRPGGICAERCLHKSAGATTSPFSTNTGPQSARMVRPSESPAGSTSLPRRPTPATHTRQQPYPPTLRDQPRPAGRPGHPGRVGFARAGIVIPSRVAGQKFRTAGDVAAEPADSGDQLVMLSCLGTASSKTVEATAFAACPSKPRVSGLGSR